MTDKEWKDWDSHHTAMCMWEAHLDDIIAIGSNQDENNPESFANAPIWCQLRDGVGAMETRYQMYLNVADVQAAFEYGNSLASDFWHDLDLLSWDWDTIPFLVAYFFERRPNRDGDRLIAMKSDWKAMIDYLWLNKMNLFKSRFQPTTFN